MRESGASDNAKAVTAEDVAAVVSSWTGIPVTNITEEESQRLLADKAYLHSVCESGAQKAAYVAEKTLRKVYKKVGFVAR